LIQQELRKGNTLTYDQESLILIKSIRINTISKLTYSDSQKFNALQADMFPGIKTEDIAYEDITNAIRQVIKDLGLQENET
jgi:dynein heavy chain 2